MFQHGPRQLVPLSFILCINFRAINLFSRSSKNLFLFSFLFFFFLGVGVRNPVWQYLIEMLIQINCGEPNVPPLNEFPWQVGIFKYKPERGASFCSGTIVSETWVLTSATCAQG